MLATFALSTLDPPSTHPHYIEGGLRVGRTRHKRGENGRMSLGDCEKVKWWKGGKVGRLEGWKVEGVAESNKAWNLWFPSLRRGEWRFAQWEHG